MNNGLFNDWNKTRLSNNLVNKKYVRIKKPKHLFISSPNGYSGNSLYWQNVADTSISIVPSSMSSKMYITISAGFKSGTVRVSRNMVPIKGSCPSISSATTNVASAGRNMFTYSIIDEPKTTGNVEYILQIYNGTIDSSTLNSRSITVEEFL